MAVPKVPRKYIEEYNELKQSGWQPTRATKQQSKSSPYSRSYHRGYRSGRRRKTFSKTERAYSSRYYYVPFDGRDPSENEKGTLSSMILINNPALLKSRISVPTHHENLCFFKWKDYTEHYLVKVNDKNLKIVTKESIKNIIRQQFDLNSIPIQYPAIVMDEYKLMNAISLDGFVPNDFNMRYEKCAMSSSVIKEIAQKYERKYRILDADFMSSRRALTHICHALMANIQPGKYKLQDPLHVLIWSENSIPSIDPKPWNKNIIQLHDITADENWEPDRLSDNPNAMYGHLFEHILTQNNKEYKYPEMTDDSNVFLFSKMTFRASNDRISLLLMSEQDCRSSNGALTEIKLSKMYLYATGCRGGISLDEDKDLRIPFWKFMAYWLQCYFANDNHMIIGFHENGKIKEILNITIESILKLNEGLRERTQFVKYALYEVLQWIKQCMILHCAVGPLVLKTQLAIDSRGNEYHQFIMKPFGGGDGYVSKLELTKLLEYGQKTHNIYFDSAKGKFHIQQVNFDYVDSILKILQTLTIR